MVPEFPQPFFKNKKWSPRSYDQTSNRSLARRNNFGPVNNGYGGRRDQNGPKSPGRDPMSLRSYEDPMGYEMGAPYVYIPTLAQDSYRGGAPLHLHGASGSSMFISYWDPFLQGSILRQVE
ncbi:hypothetical protein R6Q59_012353 [Mikania micrantha]